MSTVLRKPGVKLGAALVVLTVAVGLFALGGGVASSQTTQLYSYAAKYTCAPEVGPVGTNFVTGPGTQYRTVVNVHNPSLNVQAVVQKKAVVALHENQNPGQISQLVPVQIGKDGAFAIDCSDIKKLLTGTGTVLSGDGLVVVISPTPLDVWAVYTARIGPGSSGLTGMTGGVDVVNVPATRIDPPAPA